MKKALAALATAAALITTSAAANDLVIIFNDLNPTPKAAFEKVVDDFKAANPDINVELSINDREAHKPAIRNFLSAGPPDVTAWYPGNRMGPFVDAGLMEDLSGLWASDPNLSTSFEAIKPTMTRDGKQWGVPYSYYQWGIYYRKDIFDKMGISELGNAHFVEDVFAVVNAPLIVRVGNAPLLAIACHRRLNCLKRGAQVRVRRPQS